MTPPNERLVDLVRRVAEIESDLKDLAVRTAETEAYVKGLDEREPGLLLRVRDLEQKDKRRNDFFKFMSGGTFLGVFTLVYLFIRWIVNNGGVELKP